MKHCWIFRLNFSDSKAAKNAKLNHKTRKMKNRIIEETKLRDKKKIFQAGVLLDYQDHEI